MKYVIVRDDDANATTPPEQLERLYRPLLELGIPVSLAVIPEVRTDTQRGDGTLEWFVQGPQAGAPGVRAIGESRALVDYLLANPGYHVAQHGLSHHTAGGRFEFELEDADAIAWRLERGARLLVEAGFPHPTTFVAPQDKLSPSSLRAVARKYRVLSCGWYERRRLPLSLWPGHALRKLTGRKHWTLGGAQMLVHPGCLLSRFRDPRTIPGAVKRAIAASELTVLVTHHWEYFPQGVADAPFIDLLHQTARELAADPEIRFISFADLLSPAGATRSAGGAIRGSAARPAGAT